jgi:pyruvate,orthophosphate dikinase
VSGEIVTSPDLAEQMANAGRKVILVRAETSPDDVHGMAKAVGLLTSKGGFVSHAAVVARGWGIPAVVGASEVEVGDGVVTICGRSFKDGQTITIDGSTGEIFEGEVCGAAEIVPEAAKLLTWARDLGITIADGDGTANGKAAVEAPADASGASAVTRADVIRGLFVKGSSTSEGLASYLLADQASVEPQLGEVVTAGLAISSAGAYRLTGEGKLEGADLMTAERERWGSCNADAALDDFVPFDHRMKETVTAWQVRDLDGQQVLNDHTDPAYDAAILADLGALHGDVSTWLDGLAAGLPRLATYGTRLDRAYAQARAGDQRYVASPRVESYHTVWFELHEDLIRLSGRKRSEEVAAGRA